jgi:hypothetical protein
MSAWVSTNLLAFFSIGCNAVLVIIFQLSFYCYQTYYLK